jgi:hypothetical protein
MQPEEAERIVNEYGGVVENAVLRFGSSAYPASMLPYDKGSIKSAILSYMVALKAMGQLTERTRNILGRGYVELAVFVEDQDAHRVAEFEQAWVRPPVTPERVKQMLASADFDAEQKHHLRVLTRICEEQRALLAELRDFEKGIGLTPHCSDDLDEAMALANEEVQGGLGLTEPANAESSIGRRRSRWKFWRR